MDQSRNILLVEGQDDGHVVWHLWNRRHRSEPPFDIQDGQGIDNLLKAIEPQIRVPGRAAVGIVADANDDPDARWAAVLGRLWEAEIEAPQALSPDGAIVDAAPRIGVWLMPDNRSTGELEDFVQKMIPDDDLVWPLARGYVRDIPQGARKFSPKKTSRAELHAWLATREEPGFMGSAIGRGDLKTDGPLCSAFLAWLEGLFG